VTGAVKWGYCRGCCAVIYRSPNSNGSSTDRQLQGVSIPIRLQVVAECGKDLTWFPEEITEAIRTVFALSGEDAVKEYIHGYFTTL